MKNKFLNWMKQSKSALIAAGATGLVSLCTGCGELAAALIISDSIDNAAANQRSGYTEGNNQNIRISNGGKTAYSFAYTDWRDLNGNGVADLNEFTRVDKNCSLSSFNKIAFQSYLGNNCSMFIGYYPKVWIKNNSTGKFVFSKMGDQISGELMHATVYNYELMNSGVNGDCKIMFQLIKPGGEVYRKEAVDEYNINFTR
jgi:hypothetical protein